MFAPRKRITCIYQHSSQNFIEKDFLEKKLEPFTFVKRKITEKTGKKYKQNMSVLGKPLLQIDTPGGVYLDGQGKCLGGGVYLGGVSIWIFGENMGGCLFGRPTILGDPFCAHFSEILEPRIQVKNIAKMFLRYLGKEKIFRLKIFAEMLVETVYLRF